MLATGNSRSRQKLVVTEPPALFDILQRLVDERDKGQQLLGGKTLQIEDKLLRVEKFLGRGAEGVVCKVHDLDAAAGAQPFALKLWFPLNSKECHADAAQKQAALLSVAALQYANKKGLAPKYVPAFHWAKTLTFPQDAGWGTLALAQQCIDGKRIEFDHLEDSSQNRADELKALQIVVATAETVAKLHQVGLYCADPWPNNFLVRGDERGASSVAIDFEGVLPIMQGQIVRPKNCGRRLSSFIRTRQIERKDYEYDSLTMFSDSGPVMLIHDTALKALPSDSLIPKVLACFSATPRDSVQLLSQVAAARAVLANT